MNPARPAALLGTWTGCVIGFLLLPLLVIAVFSFSAQDMTALPLTGPSLRWYVALWRSGDLIDAVANSAVVAAAAAVVSATLGTGLAIGLSRTSPRVSGRLGAVLAGPMMTPHLVIGIALLNLYSLLGVDLSLLTVVLGHVVVATPYVLLVVSARLAGLDPRIEEAARDLGASAWRVTVDVLLPYLAPAVVSATLVAFTLSFDEVVITFFTVGNQNTLPTTIWAMLRFGITPQINAVSTLAMVLTVILALSGERLLRGADGDGRKR